MATHPLILIERNSPEVERMYALASEELKAELLRGVVCMSPAPRPIHQFVLLRLGRRLARYDHIDGGPLDPGGWVFLPEPELHLGDRPDKLRPDLAGWRLERSTFRNDDASAIAVAPDWVCEILSPSTEAIDRGTKAPLYAEAGVSWLWFMDPEAGSLEIYQNDRAVFRPVKTLMVADLSAPVVGAPPFDALSLVKLFED